MNVSRRMLERSVQRQLLHLNEIVSEMVALLQGRSHSLKKIIETGVRFANLQTGRTAPIPVNLIVCKRMQNARIALKHS